MDRASRLTAQVTLVVAITLAVIATATALTIDAPRLLVWVGLAAAAGFYARRTIESLRARSVEVETDVELWSRVGH